VLVKLKQGITQEEPVLCGPSSIGFGSTRLNYASGKELEWPSIGFNPRKTGLSVCITCHIKQYQPLVDKLDKHSVGAGCLYIKRLSDVRLEVLEELSKAAMQE